jgi:hypothetical protein
MSIASIFFICLAAVVLGLVLMALNFILFAKKFETDSFKRVFIIHVISGLCYGLGSLGMLITGIIWIVQTIKGA